MIKLLALDLDGTVLNSRGEVSQRNLKALRDAEGNGVYVTIATGRRFLDARPIAFKLGLNAPIITHNGTLIKHAETLETVSVRLIAPETVLEILAVGRKFGADPMMSCDPDSKGTLYYDRVSDDNFPLQKYLDWSRRLHGEGVDSSIVHTPSLEKIAPDVKTIHISFSGHCEPMSHLQMMLSTGLGSKAKVLATVYPQADFTLLDVLPPEASKGFGLCNLAQSLGLGPENVMAMGDNFNDLEMLEYAGTPVIMGNAAPELLQNEKYAQTLSNDEDGVALAIEKHILI
ncbi:MAG TPA: Cof-type HAD-IIB family hydrolase [Pyrinomonadaceae bacterium]|jgi:Cof subfamily protein (haloacid dehalogenase superfamily)|nr:Cof-type HAD-IIB family hydrolase [Pyrinomonadaceae bacterium]